MTSSESAKPKFLSDSGDETTADDPDRLVWYPAGDCCFWTDDWNQLKSAGGIPICPECGSVGFQAKFSKWDSGARKYQAKKPAPKYVELVNFCKNKCRPFGERFDRMSLGKLYPIWIESGGGFNERRSEGT